MSSLFRAILLTILCNALLYTVLSVNPEEIDYEYHKRCQHLKYLQDSPQYGMHLVCATPIDRNSTEIFIIVDGFRSKPSIFYPGDSGKIDSLLRYVYSGIGRNDRSYKSPSKWKLFNFQGDTIDSIEAFIIIGSGAIYTNGNFVWPGVRVGYQQFTQEGYHLTTLSLRPLVLNVKSFLEQDECLHIKELSSAHMAPSETSKMDHDLEYEDTKWRTSTTYFLRSHGNPRIQAIDERVAKLTRTRIKQQEDVQVLRYDVGQHYGAHTDYFDLQYYTRDAGVLHQTKNGEINRFATVLWYLSDVEEGGHTIFPMSYGLEKPIDFDDCSSEVALKIPPKLGEVIIFYNLFPDGGYDETSLHGACPVIKGMKWAANKWIWSGDL